MFLEKEIEKIVTDHAVKTGWLAYKWVSPGKAGVPDRIYFYNGHTLCVEFKTLGKKPTALQAKHIRALQRAGIGAEVIDNVTEGKYLLDELVEQWK